MEPAAREARPWSQGVVLNVLYLNVILYALCYQVQSPVEPYLVAKLVQGDDGEAFSRVQAWFSVIQTFGSVAVGWALDKFGLRWAFVLNFVSAALSYGILARATTIELLYLSKVPTLFMAGFLCAQTLVSKCTASGKSRVAALGRLTACYTVGATLGPALGGYLGANVDHYAGARLAVGGSLLSAALSLVFVPAQVEAPAAAAEEEKAEEDAKGGGAADKEVDQKQQQQAGALGRMRRCVAAAWELLLTKILTGAANSMMATALPLILKNTFEFREDELGLAQSAMTFLTALCNAFFLGPLAAAMGSLVAVIRLCLWGTVAGLAAQGALAYSSALSAEALISCRLVLNLFQFILAGNLTGESTSRVPRELKGTLLGLEHSLFAAVRIFSPTAAVALLSSAGVAGLTLANAGIYLVTAAAWALPGKARSDYKPVPAEAEDKKDH